MNETVKKTLIVLATIAGVLALLVVVLLVIALLPIPEPAPFIPLD